jgi:hypothetical protein
MLITRTVTTNLLFGVVCRICKYPWVYSSFNAVKTPDYNAIGISMNKVIIKQEPPNSVHDFTAAVGQQISLL